MEILRYRWESEVRLQTDHLSKIDEMHNRGKSALKFTSSNHTVKETQLHSMNFENDGQEEKWDSG